VRLNDALLALAFTAGGQGGACLAHQLAMPVSPRILLRLMHMQPTAYCSQPRIVGIDDWAWKKGRNYGTICVDLERHQPIDLLSDRSPESVAAWLAAHPDVEIISRDRSGGYADGTTRGAQQATQVADRWHVLKNLLELYHYIHDLHAKKVDVANIARQVGVSRQTVYRYLRLQQPPQPTHIHVARPHIIDLYKPYLVQRLIVIQHFLSFSMTC
jgi:hypothetical protein